MKVTHPSELGVKELAALNTRAGVAFFLCCAAKIRVVNVFCCTFTVERVLDLENELESRS